MRIEVAPIVEADLDEIMAYIARHNPVRAVTFARELRAQFPIIARNPAGYQLRPDIAPGARTAVFGKYLILFRVERGVLYIARVLHGARDLGSLSL